MEHLKKFAELSKNRKLKVETSKAIQSEQSELSSDRLYRATGSRYDDISFKEVKDIKGTKKQDYIDWILSKEGGEDLLKEQINLKSFEKYMDLSAKDLRDIVSNISGEFKPSKNATWLYLDELLGECLTGQHKPYMSSASTRWGHENEPLAIEAYIDRMLKENNYLVFKTQQFVINPKLNSFGSTPDILVFDSRISLEKPIYIVEIKCPHNQAYHAKNIRTKKIDDRYKKQCLGHMWNNPSATELHFVSFDKRVKLFKDKKLHILRVQRKNIAHEILELEKEMIAFDKLYRKECKEMGFDLDDLLK